MKFTLIDRDREELQKYKVKASDGAHQFWERNSLSIEYGADIFFCRS